MQIPALIAAICTLNDASSAVPRTPVEEGGTQMFREILKSLFDFSVVGEALQHESQVLPGQERQFTQGTMCCYCCKPIEGEHATEGAYYSPTSTGPWFYHPDCWKRKREMDKWRASRASTSDDEAAM